MPPPFGSIQCHTNATTDGATLISNGDGASGGFGLRVHENCCSGILDGRAILKGTVNPDCKWCNIAQINDNETWKLFVDGVLDVSGNSAGSAPVPGFLTIGAVFYGNSGRYENITDGKIDEIRIFTFKEGEFVESDLECYVKK